MSSKKDDFICRVCSQEFSSERGLHAHLKTHNLILAEYYTKYYPRYNLYTGDPLPFKNKQDYFNKDFFNYDQLIKWCEEKSDLEVKEYIVNLLKKRVAGKSLKVGPCHLELRLHGLPTVDIFQKHFGSYTAACELVGVKPMFTKRLTKSFSEKSRSDIKIFIDTREQQPLSFSNSESMKLEFGDYAVGGEDYDYTYVDRKGEQDFKSTLSKNNLERFEYELQRTKDFDSYLFIVVESDVDQIEANNRKGAHKSNLKYIYHNMRVLNHKFHGHCQFLFTGSRKNSEKIIPKLLTLGKQLWDTDIQYYIDKGVV
jgi:hypothetical protein